MKEAIMLGQIGHGKTTLAVGLRNEQPTKWLFHDCTTFSDYMAILKRKGRLDCGILVVDVTEGAMPQTREHILYAAQFGIKKLIVFLNKCDLVADVSVVSKAESEVTELLAYYGFEGVSVLSGSALDCTSVAELYSKF